MLAASNVFLGVTTLVGVEVSILFFSDSRSWVTVFFTGFSTEAEASLLSPAEKPLTGCFSVEKVILATF